MVFCAAMTEDDTTRRGAPASLTAPPPPPVAIAVMTAFTRQIADGRARTLTSNNPEGPHALRVGLRRLRSGLRYFRPLLPQDLAQDLARHLTAEARWLGQEVGQLRDLDVLWRDTIAPRAKAQPDDMGLAALSQLFEGTTLRMQVAVRKTLVGPRVGRFISDLDQLGDPALWDLPDPRAKALLPLTRQMLNRRHDQAERLGQHFDTLSIDDRHAFRKDLKKLRYSLEIAHALHGRKHTARFIKVLKKLQDRLGDMNDAAVAEEVLTSATAHLPQNTPARIAAMALIDDLNGKARLNARKVRKGWAAITGDRMI